ncbi:amino acid permease [Pinibacter soli]|uniref:Amino acid permease n=1 Tax=Pinibacter soli TaxID=3044211 RepID=A0ABT6RGM3_9BACT|nr:amino acid permease [Pinibacter soli]MDI3321712.1 amino acid permease [Pinibacter soli]
MSNSLFRKKSIAKIVKDAEQGFGDGHDASGLQKILTVRDLTFMGIAAVVGAGIFSTIGTAAFNGGPGISLLFIITAVTCGFSALCYAEFASRVPIAGSAYTYAYVSFGELIAWIIGWALILEYAIGNIVVAISWSGYFNNLLMGLGIHLPGWLLNDPSTAFKNFTNATAELASGKTLTDDARQMFQSYISSWNNAPIVGGKHFFINLPAFIIVVLITTLAYIGIKESKKTTNFMVIFKILVIIFVIILGFFYVKPANWHPFLPNGFGGVLAGVSAVFYAYIGFDAISTTAEECRNPQRDLPRGMIYSLVICTVLYILIALVLTGMVNYSELKVPDPLAYVFHKIDQKWISYIISISAVVATTSVMLVFQVGQPRIWMSMSRDGLLPKRFSEVHKKYKTPSYATIITGIVVGVPTLFMPMDMMTDLTSIGTLFAFVLVSAGVLLLPKNENRHGGFRLPYINGRFIVPVLFIIFIYLMKDRIITSAQNLGKDNLQEVLFLVYMLIGTILSVLTFIRSYSMIPILGVLSCAYLLIEIPAISWVWFFIWMAVGLVIYFFYGYRKSRLAASQQGNLKI